MRLSIATSVTAVATLAGCSEESVRARPFAVCTPAAASAGAGGLLAADPATTSALSPQQTALVMRVVSASMQGTVLDAAQLEEVDRMDDCAVRGLMATSIDSLTQAPSVALMHQLEKLLGKDTTSGIISALRDPTASPAHRAAFMAELAALLHASSRMLFHVGKIAQHKN